MATSENKSGLEGVVVADTLLSDVDGERGRLIVAGKDIEDLAESNSFEDLLGLLGFKSTSGSLPDALGRARAEVFPLVSALALAHESADGMDALRTSLSFLSRHPGALGSGPDAELAIVAATAVFAAAWTRRRAGAEPLAPDPKASHAEDYVRMSTGKVDKARASGLDAYLVTVADHGMNASTFTARVIASTGSDSISAVTGAIGALKGPLHGGAPGPVLDMLDAIGAPDNASAWLKARIDAKERIMGMGHRIYRTRDPRALVLEKALRKLGELPEARARLAFARAVEDAALALLRERYPDRPLCANVEFYTAVLLEAVGIPRESFSITFAAGRVAGWLAHVREQRATGRLIRPASKYIGAMPVTA